MVEIFFEEDCQSNNSPLKYNTIAILHFIIILVHIIIIIRLLLYIYIFLQILKSRAFNSLFSANTIDTYAPRFRGSSRGTEGESEGRNFAWRKIVPLCELCAKPLWRIKRNTATLPRKETSNRPTSSDILKPLRYRV